VGSLLFGGRGRLTSAAHRQKAIELISEAKAAGSALVPACCEIGISLRTLKRWRKAFGGDGDGVDRRKGSDRLVGHRLSEEERQRILLTCNQPEYASLPPGQIVPALADQGLFIGSESSFYRVLHQAGQCHRRGRARLPQEPRSVPRLRADRPNQVWSWDISFLPTTVRGVWLYLYLVVDVWSRKVVAWDVAEAESAQIAADLVQRACLKERYHRPSGFGSRQCQQPPLILHADNGNALAAGFSKSCVGPRWNHGSRRWGCSDPSPGQGSQTTTRTRNPCSERSNTGPTTPAGHSPPKRRPANGWQHLWTGTTTDTGTAASNS
jgi:hypothetical protein